VRRLVSALGRAGQPSGQVLDTVQPRHADPRLHAAGVCPTVLSLYGLPVGLDMDGKPLVQVFDRPVQPEYIDSWDAVEGDSGTLPEEARRDPWAEQEALNQLIELGYVEKPDDNAHKAVEHCERETDYDLAGCFCTSTSA
jgi:hypothetical protein